MSDEPLEILLKQRKRINLRKKDEDKTRAWADYYLYLWDDDGDFRRTGLNCDQLEHLLGFIGDSVHLDAHILSFAKDILQQWRDGGDPRRELSYAHGDPLMLSVSDLFKWVSDNPALQKERVWGLIRSVTEQFEPENGLFRTGEDHLTNDPVQIFRLGFDREYQNLRWVLDSFIRWMIDSRELPPFEEMVVLRGGGLSALRDQEDGEMEIEFDPEDDEES